MAEYGIIDPPLLNSASSCPLDAEAMLNRLILRLGTPFAKEKAWQITTCIGVLDAKILCKAIN